MRRKLPIKKRKILRNPKLFESELNSLSNKRIWIFVYGKSLRLRLNLTLSNKPSTIIDQKKEIFESPGYVAVDNKGNEIFFTTALIEKIDLTSEFNQPIIYLRPRTFGIYD